jgi:hypothetical protein
MKLSVSGCDWQLRKPITNKPWKKVTEILTFPCMSGLTNAAQVTFETYSYDHNCTV